MYTKQEAEKVLMEAANSLFRENETRVDAALKNWKGNPLFVNLEGNTSELVCLRLAELYRESGWKVTIGCYKETRGDQRETYEVTVRRLTFE